MIQLSMAQSKVQSRESRVESNPSTIFEIPFQATQHARYFFSASRERFQVLFVQERLSERDSKHVSPCFKPLRPSALDTPLLTLRSRLFISPNRAVSEPLSKRQGCS